MIEHVLIAFDDRERAEIVRALPHGLFRKEADDPEAEGSVISRFLGHVRQREPMNAEFLARVWPALLSLSARLEEESTVPFWRTVGAPGGDDAVEGLAKLRVEQAELVRALKPLVETAARAAGPREVRLGRAASGSAGAAEPVDREARDAWAASLHYAVRQLGTRLDRLVRLRELGAPSVLVDKERELIREALDKVQARWDELGMIAADVAPPGWPEDRRPGDLPIGGAR